MRICWSKYTTNLNKKLDIFQFPLASIVNIGQIFGSIISGSLAGAYGRKKVILLSSIFMIIGWAFIGFSDGSYGLLMTGRLIHGAFFLASVSQVYLAEISDSKRRYADATVPRVGVIIECPPNGQLPML